MTKPNGIRSRKYPLCQLFCNFNIQALANYMSRALSVGSSYQSAMVQGLALGKPQLWSEVSISKFILKERLNLSLRMTDPFSLMQKGYDTYGRSSSQQTIYHFDTRFVYFGISYRFNNHKASKQNYDDGGIKVFLIHTHYYKVHSPNSKPCNYCLSHLLSTV